MNLRLFAQLSHWLMLAPILQVVAYPSIITDSDASNATDLDTRAENFYLRILPLGGSITLGWGSSTGNGFRKPLRDQLRKDGWNVNMVGTKSGATTPGIPITGPAMKDNSVEAVAGYRVDQIQGILQSSLKYLPNVVLINAGVNDCTQNYDVGNIGNRMNSLLDDVFNKIAGTTVLLSTLIPSVDPSMASCHDSVNSQYRNIVNTRSSQGQKILLAEMVPGGSYWNIVVGGDYQDNTHPTDSGHAKMASIWYETFKTAYSKGWITAPAVTSAVDDTASDNTCAKQYGNSESTKTQTQSGSGWDDGVYIHHGDPQGERFYSGEWPGEKQYFYMASLVDAADRNDDIIQYLSETSDGKRKYYLYRNNGPGVWRGTPIAFEVPDTCIARGVRWADMNGDGLEDFVCIAPNGDAVVSINRGSLKFENLGVVKHTEGPKQKYIRLGDIDGDGRADYCALNDDGSMRCWRNGGLKDASDNWQAMGTVFQEKNFGDIDGVRLVDINGDGRADYLWIDDDGKTWTYTNNRGCVKGDIGQGLTPIWRAGENREYGAGPTMIGIGSKNVRDKIAFGRAYGYEDPQSFDFLPSRDYIYIDETALTGAPAMALKWANVSVNSNHSTNSATYSNSTKLYNNSSDISHQEKRADYFTYEYSFKIWKNKGTGGGKLKGDGDRYCNMMGRANGRQDYVWIWSNGKMWIWEALDSFPPQPKYWGKDHLMWDITASRSINRRDLTLADWDGDGACDIIYADPVNGKVEVWLNKIKSTGNLEFDYAANPAPGCSCDQPRGRGQFDVAVRFADLTGNGRPDYLCMEKDGRTKAYLHGTDGSFTWQPQVKQSDGYDRANLRFADVDGDGLADLLWSDKFKGDAMVWKNMGAIPAAGTGSSFTWVNQGFLFNAPAQGTCLQFTDLDGNGRADMVFIDALQNTATTWFNNCPDSGGDDSDTFTSPSLPTAPDNNPDSALDPAKLEEYKSSLIAFLAAPVCDNPGPFDQRRRVRSVDYEQFTNVTAVPRSSGASTVTDLVARADKSTTSELEAMLLYLLTKTVTDQSDAMYQATSLLWNDYMANAYSGLRMPALRDYVSQLKEYFVEGPIQIAHAIVCSPNWWSAYAGGSEIATCPSFCALEDCVAIEAGALLSTSINPWYVNKKHKPRAALENEWANPPVSALEERKALGTKRSYTVHMSNGTFSKDITITLPDYLGIADLEDDDELQDETIEYAAINDCGNGQVARGALPSTEFFDMEHPFDGNVIGRFMMDAAAGRLRSGAVARSGPVSMSFFITAQTMPVAINAPPLPGGNDYDYTYDRVMECLGSRENRDSFVILNHDIHNAKTQLMQGNDARSRDKIRSAAKDATRSGDVMPFLRDSIAFINYMNHQGVPDVNGRLTTIVNNVGAQWRHAQDVYNGLNPGLLPTTINLFWSEWVQDFFGVYIIGHTREFVQFGIDEMRRNWGVRTGALALQINEELRSLEDQLANLSINTANMN